MQTKCIKNKTKDADFPSKLRDIMAIINTVQFKKKYRQFNQQKTLIGKSKRNTTFMELIKGVFYNFTQTTIHTMKNKFISLLASFTLFIGLNLTSCNIEKKDFLDVWCKTVTKTELPSEIDNGEVLTSMEFRDNMIVYNVVIDETVSDLRIDSLTAHLEETIEDHWQALAEGMSTDTDIRSLVINCKKLRIGIGYNYKSLQTRKAILLPIEYENLPK